MNGLDFTGFIMGSLFDLLSVYTLADITPRKLSRDKRREMGSNKVDKGSNTRRRLNDATCN